MRAEYDSRADVLSIDLIEVERWDGSDAVDADFCTIATVGDRPANIELLSPAQHLDLLAVAAERHDLDAEALDAAARSALAAPDRTVVVDVLTPGR
ncbi:MAG: hypothetical protein ACRDKV_08075 [Solirubrobacterales bacterium]